MDDIVIWVVPLGALVYLYVNSYKPGGDATPGEGATAKAKGTGRKLTGCTVTKSASDVNSVGGLADAASQECEGYSISVRDAGIQAPTHYVCPARGTCELEDPKDPRSQCKNTSGTYMCRLPRSYNNNTVMVGYPGAAGTREMLAQDFRENFNPNIGANWLNGNNLYDLDGVGYAPYRVGIPEFNSGQNPPYRLGVRGRSAFYSDFLTAGFDRDAIVQQEASGFESGKASTYDVLKLRAGDTAFPCKDGAPGDICMSFTPAAYVRLDANKGGLRYTTTRTPYQVRWSAGADGASQVGQLVCPLQLPCATTKLANGDEICANVNPSMTSGADYQILCDASAFGLPSTGPYSLNSCYDANTHSLNFSTKQDRAGEIAKGLPIWASKYGYDVTRFSGESVHPATGDPARSLVFDATVDSYDPKTQRFTWTPSRYTSQ